MGAVVGAVTRASVVPPVQPIDGPFAERVVTVLTPLLGPHTAKRALAMICKRAGKDAAALGPDDVELAQTTLRPMLRTLIGNEVTVRVLADLGATEEPS
ncbi:hypothetical protein [Nannocystis pusilla]|uniref:Uncharacterized protein n=1 Tax=Nannocystis pusilla TaxID=889268 RepID=A0ABS7U3A0_9BACT|nr:hypothetical protein [Nannocystis pusilla]MBZ5715017.1 hypothetical protein [Nannocystis pusilla]